MPTLAQDIDALLGTSAIQTTHVAHKFVLDRINTDKANLSSPTFTGTPLITTTPTPLDNSHKIADTAYVDSAVSAGGGATLPYKSFVARFSGSGEFISPTVIHSDFGATTFTFTNPSNSRVLITADSSVFTSNKSTGICSGLNHSGALYIPCPTHTSSASFEFNYFLHDGTLATTPNFSNVWIEIRVYN